MFRMCPRYFRNGRVMGFPFILLSPFTRRFIQAKDSNPANGKVHESWCCGVTSRKIQENYF